MNRISGRAGIVLIFALVLVAGLSFFVVEFCMDSGDWVLTEGSPHVYSGSNIGTGLVVDSDGQLLLDLRNGRTYSSDVDLKKSVVHWLGDRQGMISAPALAHYADALVGYDLITGTYAYGDTAGKAVLTLSGEVQKTALAALGSYSGTVAVYNYKTGALLCAVTTPNYDPDNVPEDIADQDAPYWNRFTQAAYIPGSIFKTVTLAAAIEQDPGILERTYTCTGRLELDSEVDVLTCETAHGTQDVKTAFRNSCNCAFAQIAQELGGDTLEHYVEQFGVTESVSFDGISTAAGKFEAGDADIFLARSAIGQHLDQVNPCTFLTYMGAIAGDGQGVTPYLVEQISLGNTVTYRAQTGTRSRIMSQETAQYMQAFMRNNVTDKYGDENFPGLDVCAKTGTAEVMTGEEGQIIKPNAMLAGFVENEEYPLAFIVCVEDAGYGSTVCVPIASQVLAACKFVLDQR